MFQFLVDLLSSAYFELSLIILLIGYFVVHRRDKRLKISGVRMVRMSIAIAVFIYFMFIWYCDNKTKISRFTFKLLFGERAFFYGKRRKFQNKLICPYANK